MPIFANVMDFDVTASAAALHFFNMPQAVVELVDLDAKPYQLDVDQTIYITAPPVRYLTPDEQKTFVSAWRNSTKLRQAIPV
jgi:hypothetical protein